MKVTNVRLGFANNSSSSHSILLFPKNHKFQDEIKYDTDWEEGASYYGWEHFVLASVEEKTKYFAVQLGCILKKQLGTELTEQIVSSLYPGVKKILGSGIDHQSQIEIPRYADGSFPLDFIKELFGYAIKNPQVVVIGGNDNGDSPIQQLEDSNKKFEEIKPLGHEFMDHIYYTTIRKEPWGWIMFNPETGAKLRFQSSNWKETDSKPNTPELVDMKITSYCDYYGHDSGKNEVTGCTFCYQNSGRKGTHVSEETIRKYFRDLREMGVFEVVLGGGEPLSHPKIIKILNDAKYFKLIPNLTTRKYSAFYNPNDPLVKAIEQNVGSFAVSVTSVGDAKAILQNVHQCGDKLFNKMVLQIIIGVVPPEEIKKIKEVAAAFDFDRFSYVGWKSCGRASKRPVVSKKYTMPQDILPENKWGGKVWVDTALLKEFPELVENYTCDTREGVHSMYLDLCEGTLSESSYTGEKIKIPDPSVLWKQGNEDPSKPKDARAFIMQEFNKFGKGK